MRALLAALVFVAPAAFAQLPAAQPPDAPKEPPKCESVVVVRCDRPETQSPEQRQRTQQQEKRRNDPLELDRIVIEADPMRKSIEEAMSRNLGTKPSWGTRTFTTAEGSQCTCMNICPPPPLPCCQCSSLTRGYSSSPGSSIFN